MYRNNFGTQTNTKTTQNQTNLFGGNYNILGNQTQNNTNLQIQS